jgi:transcriptional regulator with XRE-family HTH domain
MNQGALSRIESGKPPDELSKLIHWASVLKIPPALLWFALPSAPHAQADSPRANRHLQRLRHARNWTTTDTAQRLRDHIHTTTGHHATIDAHTIQRLENGEITDLPETYRTALRTVYGLTNDDQLGLTQQPQPSTPTTAPAGPPRATNPDHETTPTNQTHHNLTPTQSPRVLFGTQLRQLREQHDLSQATLGARLYLSPDAVATWEKGRSLPDQDTAGQLDETLNADGKLLTAWRHAITDKTHTNHKIRAQRLLRDWTQEQAATAVATAYTHATGTPPTGIDAAWISRLERGRLRWPTPEHRTALRSTYGVQTDAELGLSGARHATGQTPVAAKQATAPKLLTVTQEESEAVTAFLADRLDTDALGIAVERLSIDYLSTPPSPMLERAQLLRSGAFQAAKEQALGKRPMENKDLILALGQLSGILAYAALDLGDASGAMSHARACWSCADRIDDNELRAWTRGTQSLISRFAGNFDLAFGFVKSGIPFAAQREQLARLRCGEAQSLANLGDANGANTALNMAEDAREHIKRPSSTRGIFAFTEAKQRYYAGSSLIWVTGKESAQRAAREAAAAIEIWQQEPAETRSLDDEALAHIYLATALIQLDEVEGAITALRPILELPPERRISWITKRLTRVSDLLQNRRYAHSPVAIDARAEIEEYSHGDV